MKKPIISLLLCLAPFIALATTYHVASRDNDDDGIQCSADAGDDCGTCSNHGTVGSSFTSCASSVTASCSLIEPCCEIQNALDIAISSGDIVEVHDGTYDFDESWNSFTVVTFVGKTANIGAAIKGCSACTAESDRRIVRGGLISTQDVPILRANTTDDDGGATTAISLGINTSANLDFVTIQSFEITGFSQDSTWQSSDGGYAHGVQFLELSSDYAVIDNLNIHDTGASAFCKIGQGVQVGGDNAWRSDNGIIKNSTFDTVTNWVDLEGGGSAGGQPNCSMNGWILRNNTIIAGCTESAGGRGFGQLYQACAVVYNNDFFNDTTNRMELYLRESTKTYWFNNFFYGWNQRAIIFNQCSGSTGGPFNCFTDSDMEHAFFNNTIECEDGSCNLVSSPDNYLSVSDDIKFRNNIVMNSASSALFDCATAGVADNVIWEHNLYDTGQTLVSGSCAANFLTLLNNQTSSSAEVFVLSGNKPTPFYSPKSDSPAIGNGTNDPIGQGADVCLLDMSVLFACSSSTSEACQDIDCSSDYEGDNRGSTWDIGADEFVTSPAGSAPKRTIVIGLIGAANGNK